MKKQLTSGIKMQQCSTMLTWVLLVQLHGWFPSMHTHHAWVLLEKILSSDFWLLENLGCYSVRPDKIYDARTFLHVQ